MALTREYYNENQQKNRMMDKILVKYHAWERYPGESLKDFKKRMKPILIKELPSEFIKKKKYYAWERYPGESLKDFKKRMKSVKFSTNAF